MPLLHLSFYVLFVCCWAPFRGLVHLCSDSVLIFFILNFPCLNYCVVFASWLDSGCNTSHVTQQNKQKDESEKSLPGVYLRARSESGRLHLCVHMSWSLEWKHFPSRSHIQALKGFQNTVSPSTPRKRLPALQHIFLKMISHLR